MPTIAEYRHLRRMAQQRERRLEQAGFSSGLSSPKPSSIKSQAELDKEFRRLERWMKEERHTVKGAREYDAEQAAKKEAQRLRRNERERERYRKKQEAAGKEVRERKKLSDEERQERRREQQRQYRERVKERTQKNIESLEELLKDMRASGDRDVQSKGNWMSQVYAELKANGIKVQSYDELKKWAAYFNERNKDREHKLYTFSQWIDDAEAKTGKTASKIKGSDIERMMNDFNQWKAEDAELAREFERDRQPEEYTADKMGNLMDLFMSIL